MTAKTKYPHIALDERDQAIIEGTTLKVAELVTEKLAYGWSPEEVHLQHPYLTLGEIHAALTYYWDHTKALDEEIAERLKRVNELREKAQSQPSPLIARLKAQGLL